MKEVEEELLDYESEKELETSFVHEQEHMEQFFIEKRGSFS